MALCFNMLHSRCFQPASIDTGRSPSCIARRSGRSFPVKAPLHSDKRALFARQFRLQATNEEKDVFVEELRIPSDWLMPSKALEESEWLRVSLHKWLDDEYCPEAANVEISRCAARSYHNSLMAKQTDLGEILLKMARDLERISFQESFHGAFSSANAAINLISQRIELLKQRQAGI